MHMHMHMRMAVGCEWEVERQLTSERRLLYFLLTSTRWAALRSLVPKKQISGARLGMPVSSVR